MHTEASSYWVIVDFRDGYLGPRPDGEPRLYTNLAMAWLFDSEASAEGGADSSGSLFAREVTDGEVRASLNLHPLADVGDRYLALGEVDRRRFLTEVTGTGFEMRDRVMCRIEGQHFSSVPTGASSPD